MSFADPDIELSDSRQRGLQLIQETGDIHQSEFWKELDVSSRTGSRIVDRLLEAELIERTVTVYGGRKTYYLEPKPQELDLELLMAGDMLSPFIGLGDIGPKDGIFTRWVMKLQYDEG